MLTARRQISNATSHNRHPADFAAAKKFLSEKALDSSGVRILSFGCSTGEELISLHDFVVLLPNHQQIVGVEVSPEARLKAIENCARYKNISVLSSEQFEAETGKYSVIFCMAVFCLFPLTKELKSMPPEFEFTFLDFERDITNIVDRLETGGLLIIKDANYCFEHTDIFAKKFRVHSPDLQDKWMVPKFDQDGNRIESRIPAYRCFIKLD